VVRAFDATPNKWVEPTFAIQLPALPLWSSDCKCGSPEVLGVGGE
jgi:hypothetical protein